MLDHRMLEAERDWLRKRLEAVEVLLEDGSPQVRRNGRAVPTGGRREAALDTDDGLRSRIRRMLEASPAGVTPKDVTDQLRADGFNPEGKTPLGLRVSNDMYRMSKAGQLRRIGRGKYKLAE